MLRASLDEVERVDGSLRLWAGEQLGERVFLRAVGLRQRPGGGTFDEIERAVRSRRGAVHLPVEAGASFATDLGHVRQIGARPPLARTFLDLVEEIRERLVEELHRLQEGIGEPGLESLLRAQHAVLAQRVLDDERHGLLGADELRHELCPAPAGDEAEEDLRTSEVADHEAMVR